MAKFKPYKILESQLDSLPIQEGQFILTTDTKKLYSDVAENTRVLISSDVITDLSVDGKIITYTRLDGSTETISTQDTTYDIVNTTKEGLMSIDDKKKLDSIEKDAQKNTVLGVKGGSETEYRTGNINITKANIGLENVENKSSSTIRGELTSSNVTAALGYTPLNSNLKGSNGGLAELDSSGKVPSYQLPSYVDDILEYSSKTNFPTTGETGKIYVETTTNKTYRWSGSSYVEIGSSIALGTTSSTAFRGDYGQAAYTHAVTNKGNAFNSGLYKITTNSEGHVTNATSVEKSDITALGIPGQDTTYSVVTTTKEGLMSATDKEKLDTIESGAEKNTVTGIKGNSESTYRVGNVNITKANIGLGNVDNTADANKSVKYATSAGKATQDSASQQINTTYLKNISVPGQRVTLTKGDGTTTSVESFTTTVNINTANIWVKLGTFNNKTQGEGGEIWLFGGQGQNNSVNQNMWAHLFIKKGYQTTVSTTNYVAASYEIFTPPAQASKYKDVKFKVFCTELGVIDVWVFFPFTYSKAYYYPAGQYDSFTVANTYQTEEPIAGDTYGVLQPIGGGIVATSSNGMSIDEAIKTISAEDGKITYTKGNNTTETITVTANPTTTILTNQNLNDVKTPGLYAAGGGNATTNKPAGIDAYGLFVYKTASGYITQELTGGNNNPMLRYIRQYSSSAWSTWTQMKYTDTTYTGSNGVSISGTVISNSGVRSVATGDNNGTIKVNTNGTSTNVAVKGLGSLAYKSSLTATDVGAIASTTKGAANGVAELDANGKVPSSQLPSYVDDTLEGYLYNSKFYKESAHTTQISGETGKIYVDLSTNKTYRWSGSAFVEISASLALGETSSTAYRGDRGKIAYDHANSKGSAFNNGLYKFTTNSHGHVTAATAVTKSDINALGITNVVMSATEPTGLSTGDLWLVLSE